MDLARALIREPDVTTARAYSRRVGLLALIYVGLFAFSTAGIALVLWNGRLLVTLSQRSNVETLVLAFLLLLFSYLGLASSAGAWGGAHVLAYRLGLALRGDAVERRKAARLRTVRRGPAVALNRLLERADRPGEAFEIAVADSIAPAGRLRIDGASVTHLDVPGRGSSDFLAFFVRQVADVLAIDPDDLDVVCWRAIDEEGWHQHVGLVDAFRALGRRTGGGTHLWPHYQLSPEHCDELARRLSEICPALREEGLLPHREFEGAHKIPIIPEPLGIISLERRERRVDPLSSMGSALLVVALLVALLVFFIVRPPWVPGV